MKKNWTDNIDKTHVEFTIHVQANTKKGKKSTHPDFEDAPARLITEWEVTGHVFTAGKNHPGLLKKTFYHEATLVEGLPGFESDLWEKAAVLVRTKTQSLDDKLKTLGYD
jgi:hypothetical protein